MELAAGHVVHLNNWPFCFPIGYTIVYLPVYHLNDHEASFIIIISKITKYIPLSPTVNVAG